jgi:hypothetical protein
MPNASTPSSAYTAGPWKYQIQGQQALITQENGPANIAVCYDPRNARLIVAAPLQNDTLHAIHNDCEAWLNEQMEMPVAEFISALKSAAEEAIAKAEGTMDAAEFDRGQRLFQKNK